MEVGQGEKVLTEAKISDSQMWWIGAAMTDQETCLDGLGREESRSIALVWRGRESVSDNERGLGFFIFFKIFLNIGRVWIISIFYPNNSGNIHTLPS